MQSSGRGRPAECTMEGVKSHSRRCWLRIENRRVSLKGTNIRQGREGHHRDLRGPRCRPGKDLAGYSTEDVASSPIERRRMVTFRAYTMTESRSWNGIP